MQINPAIKKATKSSEEIMNSRRRRFSSKFSMIVFSLLLAFVPLASLKAQDTVTGAFAGTVRDRQTGAPITDATVRFTNQRTQVSIDKRVNGQGEFYLGLLQPGGYTIQVSAPGYKTEALKQLLVATKQNTVQPVPVTLEREAVAQTQTQPKEATPAAGQTPATGQTPTANQGAAPVDPVGPIIDSVEITAELNSTDGRRSGLFTEKEVSTLPLGGSTLTRSFDELALLLPGVALPPQTQGGVAGPGVGPGVGSAGQFAINGLRSRANNFTVDGSDNNDEDIGVRRQGYLALVPQPIETIREYQVITALAPAQFGRNLAAQVNAISKSGGYQTHGEFYGFINASNLNARDFFDTVSDGRPRDLQGRATDGSLRDVYIRGQKATFVNPAAGQDSRTFGQAGFVLGGPLLPKPASGAGKSAFYFLSFEGQLLNANQEKSFAVPTVEERGLNASGATGLQQQQLNQNNMPFTVFGYPTSLAGSAIFSLFPFPNNPGGIYGRNTFTQILPASAQGNVASVKFEHNFSFKEREQSLTGRYNRTNDWRNIPATGGALFATLRPVVRTHNFSLFHNSELSGPNAVTPLFNQFRASYGRTRLLFEEERDTSHLIPSRLLPNEPFLLNAPYLFNFTRPDLTCPFTTGGSRCVNYDRAFLGNTQILDSELNGGLGPVGQVIIAGYSPLGVDVFNFPQRRVNNTYQLADTLTMRKNAHNLTFGTDYRRTQLNSDLPRNARPLITFGSTPAVDFDPATGTVRIDSQGNYIFTRFFNPVFAAAAAAPNNLSQTLAAGPLAVNNSYIGLRYHQFNFFGQDEWRIRPSLSLSYGLRYEYNTPPREVDSIIEKTFENTQLNLLPRQVQDMLRGRETIFDPDRNNFAPRVGLAYARNIFGTNSTVFRAGYGLYYDQIIGAVVSQSRNVFPNFLTLNTGGGLGTLAGNNGRIGQFGTFNPALSIPPNFGNGIRFADGSFFPFVVPGTLNRLNEPNINVDLIVNVLNRSFPGEFGFTLPDRDLPTPLAHHYSFAIEQQLGLNWVASAAYVGTKGENLLRLITPNLGPNLVLPGAYFFLQAFSGTPTVGQPIVFGYRLTPGQTLKPNDASNNVNFLRPSGSRPIAGAGTIYLYQTNAESRYDSLQLQLRGRFRTALQAQLGYTFAKAIDDVSDVFDLAGASALPQNSSALGNERGPANFDVRHRFTANFNYIFPTLATRSRTQRFFLGGFEMAGIWQYQTGQPFTVNSLFDINFDGNYTDRLNTTSGVIIARGNNRQPLRLTVSNDNPNLVLPFLAPFGRDGAVGRNTFRAADFFQVNLALIKNFAINERHKVIFRVEAFNVSDRANFGIPVRFLEAPAFGEATETVTPGRRIQFALKYSF
jgi:hypothetical protein